MYAEYILLTLQGRHHIRIRYDIRNLTCDLARTKQMLPELHEAFSACTDMHAEEV